MTYDPDDTTDFEDADYWARLDVDGVDAEKAAWREIPR